MNLFMMGGVNYLMSVWFRTHLKLLDGQRARGFIKVSAFEGIWTIRVVNARCLRFQMNRAFTSCRCTVSPGGGTGPTIPVLSVAGRVPPRGAGSAATDNFGMHRQVNVPL